MDYQQLLAQRRSHPAWRLLLADHAPMIASFLHHSFVAPNVRGVSREQLASQLDDHLFALHETAGETLFPKAASAYLDDWASDARGWLRKFYLPGGDEPHYDLTAEAELALGWMQTLDERPFVGTESRMHTVARLLQDIVDGRQLNPRERIAQLRTRKAGIDAEIARIEQGRLDLMEPVQVRERFLQAEGTARELLADMRAIERGFRRADRAFRERAAAGNRADERQDANAPLSASDEGASFLAFRDLLASPARQEELTALLDEVMSLDAVRGLAPDSRLRRIHFDLLEAADATQQTVDRLSVQLRRHLDDQARLENRRIMQLVRGIERKALALRGRVVEPAFIEIDEPAPALALPMDRPLFSPPFKPRIRQPVLDGEEAPVPADALFAQVHIDHLRLASNVRDALRSRSQVSLGALAVDYPIEHGLAELAAYLKLATRDLHCAIDEERTEVVRWTDAKGNQRQATLPLVIYTL